MIKKITILAVSLCLLLTVCGSAIAPVYAPGLGPNCVEQQHYKGRLSQQPDIFLPCAEQHQNYRYPPGISSDPNEFCPGYE